MDGNRCSWVPRNKNFASIVSFLLVGFYLTLGRTVSIFVLVLMPISVRLTYKEPVKLRPKSAASGYYQEGQ